ncbi:MAG: hypothetical protein AB7D36_02865 [Oscillospiraceae bacterium]
MVFFDNLLQLLAHIGILMFQFVAVIIMIFACLSTVRKFAMHKHHTVIVLRKWMNVALLFILCSEILRLVTVHSFSEVIVILCIVIIHAAVSILSNWEMSRELKYYNQKLASEEAETLTHTHKGDINL